MDYKIVETNNEDEIFDSVEVEADFTEEQFDEEINSEYETVTICDVSFDPATVLKEVDPTAYNVEKGNRASFLPSKWACPICGKEYDDEDEAKWCCQEEETLYNVCDDRNREISGPFETEGEAEEEIDRLNEIDEEDEDE